jgi:hypothetical protein
MKLRMTLSALVGALVLAAAPSMALAEQPADPGSQGKGPHYAPDKPEKPETPGPGATLPEKARAYGVYCKDKSREHVAGEKGTEFSRCVTTMARLAKNDELTPRQACKGESRKHVKGEKGTDFSRCVKAAAKLRREQRQQQA